MAPRKGHLNMLKARPAARAATWPSLLSSIAIAVVIAVVFSAAAFGALAASAGRKAYGFAAAGKEDLKAAERSFGEFDIAGAVRHLDDAATQFLLADGEVRKFAPFGSFPFVGPRIREAERLIRAATLSTEAARDVLSAVDGVFDVLRESDAYPASLAEGLPSLTTVFKDLSTEQKRRILASIADDAPKIREAREKIAAALPAIDAAISEPAAAPFAATLASARERLAMLEATLAAVEPVTSHVPWVLGYPSPRTYLFFLQNNTELRPTGGFLGTFGVLTVADADVRALETHDVYSYDAPSESSVRPTPPEPLRKYLGVTKWYLRDANWSPDFPTAAAVMRRFYREEASVVLGGEEKVPEIDGIIAVTPKLASDLLRMTGPIAVGGVTFTADNLVDELEFQVEKAFVAAGVPFEQRKRILAALVEEVVDRISGFSLERLFELADVVQRDLAEGHVVLETSDEEVQRLILGRDWGGRMRPVDGDYLSVIDANLASLKTDPVVRRSVAYSIGPGPDGAFVGKVAITYENTGSFTWKTTRYRTYTRVYLPSGSRLIRAVGAMENDKIKDPARRPGTPDEGTELGRAVFGAFVSVEPGEKRTLEFDFHPSPDVVAALLDGSYRLDAEKQAGTLQHGLTLDIDFGKKLRTAVPAEDPDEWGDSRYKISTDLRTDRHFEVSF